MSEPKRILRCDCLHSHDGPDALQTRGALVRVLIGPNPEDEDACRRAATPNVSAVLMIDTGAAGTFVEDRVIARLGLPADRMDPIVGIFPEPEDCPIYRLAITIPMIEDGTGHRHNIVLPVEIGGLPPPKRAGYFMGLLGRDCLAGMGFVYEGTSGVCFLDSDRHVDPAQIIPLRQAARERGRRQ